MKLGIFIGRTFWKVLCWLQMYTLEVVICFTLGRVIPVVIESCLPATLSYPLFLSPVHVPPHSLQWSDVNTRVSVALNCYILHMHPTDFIFTLHLVIFATSGTDMNVFILILCPGYSYVFFSKCTQEWGFWVIWCMGFQICQLWQKCSLYSCKQFYLKQHCVKIVFFLSHC